MGKVALLSVYDKTGIVEFARALIDLGFQLVASGGTCRVLGEASLSVKDVADLVGGGAILGHRVVTLSREIHAMILADLGSEEQRAELAAFGFEPIELVCVDLYPLKGEIAKAGATEASVIEKTDIGGPTLLRSAAKGRRVVIADPADRASVLDWLRAGKPDEDNFLRRLAAKAEAVVANYALTSARYHGRGQFDGVVGVRVAECVYGENAHQLGAGHCRNLDAFGDRFALHEFRRVLGSPPSYNNLCDLDRALQTVTHIAAGWDVNFFTAPKIAIAVKHGNPCGAAVAKTSSEALIKMVKGDQRAIMGGLVMVNFPLDEELAERLLTYGMEEGRRLLDAVVAPEVTDEALEVLKRKKDKCRVFVNPALAHLDRESLDQEPRIRYVRGGFLHQPNYTFVLNLNDPRIEKSERLVVATRRDLVLAWAVGATSNSNTVTLVRDGMLIGNGVGQQDRVGCCHLAVERARAAGHEDRLSYAVAYSDSFFPFTDGPQVLYKAGIETILASSGSVRDQEVRDCCKWNGVTLLLVPDKVGRGFFGH